MQKGTKKVSASQLAKFHEVTGREVRDRLVEEGLLIGDGQQWSLTDKGVEAGGELRNSQYGEYIAWPEDLFQPSAATEEPAGYNAKVKTSDRSRYHESG